MIIIIARILLSCILIATASLCCHLCIYLHGAAAAPAEQQTHQDREEQHRHNAWAVIVGMSRYYYNYRHAANALSFYRTVKRLGIPDNQIILMLGDDIACNSRNPEPGRVINDFKSRLDLYGDEVEVDFRGEDVSVDNFLRLLTGRQSPYTPLSKRLLTDSDSHIFVFLTGHGGEGFLKFQDWQEITAEDISNAFHQMYKQNRYHRVLLVVDSCQSSTMSDPLISPNIIGVGCSKKGQNSYSHHDDPDLGVAVIDRFTYYSLQFLERVSCESNTTLAEFFSSLNPRYVSSDTTVRMDLSDKPLKELPITSFFGSAGRSGSVVRFIDDYTKIFKRPIEEFPYLWKTNLE